MMCPRCRSPIEDSPVAVGPFRAAPSEVAVPRCERCRISLLRKHTLQLLVGDVPRVAGYMSIERHRKPVTEGCPDCLVSLEQIFAEYDEHQVEYEQCYKCHLVVLDDGELQKLKKLVLTVRRSEPRAPALAPVDDEPDRTILQHVARFLGVD